MTARQAHIMSVWFSSMSWETIIHEEDLDIIENVLLPLFKDNHNKVSEHPDSMTFHELYNQWIFVGLPEYRKDIEDCE